MEPQPDSEPRSVTPIPLELTYAPPAKDPRRVIWVVLAGLFTTALTLLGVYLLQTQANENVMGWYANYVIPAGAILAGLAASSGYAIVSLMVGVKIRRNLLLVILGLMLASYFAAQYAEFASAGPFYVPVDPQWEHVLRPPPKIAYRHLGFAEYFHRQAINWTWKKEHESDKDEPQPLGLFGYFFVGLGVVGFTFSGLILPGALATRPYCDLCERYMKTKELTTWDKEVAQASLARARDAATTGDANAFRSAIAQTPSQLKAARKANQRLRLQLVRCTSCASGHLELALLTGKGKKEVVTKLPRIELTPELVKQIV